MFKNKNQTILYQFRDLHYQYQYSKITYKIRKFKLNSLLVLVNIKRTLIDNSKDKFEAK